MAEVRRIVKSLSRDAKSGDIIALEADEIHYLADVLRLESGKKIFVYGRDNSSNWSATYSGTSLILEEKDLSTPTAETVLGTIFLPCLKGEFMERAIEDIVPFSPAMLCIYQADRSVAKITSNKESRLQKIVEHSVLQSRISKIPDLKFAPSLQAALKDNVSGQLVTALLSENSKGIESLPICNSYSIIVGPEGDFSETEQKIVLENSSFLITVGESILRSHLAAITCAVTIITAAKLARA